MEDSEVISLDFENDVVLTNYKILKGRLNSIISVT
jgi:hypothetical protein